MIRPPHYPIVYVRGYAGTQAAVEATVATPYMGFNEGSTKYRQGEHKEDVIPRVFESPLLRLMKEHGYVDAYRDGQLLPEGPIEARSIWIFRYYDVTSEELGPGERKEIEFHANRLREFLLHVRGAVLEPGEPKRRFKVHLVAHSMGGLVCRCYLQNPDIPDLAGKTPGRAENKGVDKLFTYATPHGGVEFRQGLGWAEGLRDFLDPNNAGNFGSRRMREFLHLGRRDDLRSLKGRFPAERVFSVVGTDSRDYGAAAGIARRAVGPMSDGLVRIRNAYVLGGPRAFVYRSHAGQYGIVNSEEGYQNLHRFLLGNARVRILLDGVKTTLPEGREITATYYIETVVSIRGIPVEIHRRTVGSQSAIFRDRKTLQARPTHLHTAFLAERCRVNRRRKSLGLLVRVRVVPEYHVNRRLRPDDHFEGAAILDAGLILEVTRKRDGHSVRYRWSERESEVHELEDLSGAREAEFVGGIPFERERIRGKFVVRVGDWNR